ncbi:hypothetical protein NMQ14_15020 [Methyloversatilis sp. XJ19-13]|uniref:hypothetical protein n=1 Tax=Methyloversatilis sp. XJ19-13 TaxID=2963430 RepID=UPI00211D0CC4|nr:hypothetical protein [Methyloversatilis sp. XJ19-13]MCQ9375564.1 hypothetical protein [Methyloversatilis sp. XJ19-13]
MKRLLALACLIGMTSVAGAQQKSREAEQLRRIRQQVQQLQQQLSAEQQKAQQAQLESQKVRDAVGAESVKLDAELRSARARGQGAVARAERLQKEVDQLRASDAERARQLEATRNSLNERTKQATESALRLQQRENELAVFQARLIEGDIRLQQCAATNLALFELGNEVIDRFERRTLGERVVEGEPFFQIGRVKLENLAEAYRDRLHEQAPNEAGAHVLQ